MPVFLSQLLLVFFVGHNLATFGLVEMSSRLMLGSAEFIGLTLFLAGNFAAGNTGSMSSAPCWRDARPGR